MPLADESTAYDALWKRISRDDTSLYDTARSMPQWSESKTADVVERETNL